MRPVNVGHFNSNVLNVYFMLARYTSWDRACLTVCEYWWKIWLVFDWVRPEGIACSAADLKLRTNYDMAPALLYRGVITLLAMAIAA